MAPCKPGKEKNKNGRCVKKCDPRTEIRGPDGRCKVIHKPRKTGYILNPASNRYVSRDGPTGRFLRGKGPDPRTSPPPKKKTPKPKAPPKQRAKQRAKPAPKPRAKPSSGPNPNPKPKPKKRSKSSGNKPSPQPYIPGMPYKCVRPWTPGVPGAGKLARYSCDQSPDGKYLSMQECSKHCQVGL